MSTEQAQWATQIREIPPIFRRALLLSDDRAIRHRPAVGAWSAVEVVGHMIDKMQIWPSRVECLLVKERLHYQRMIKMLWYVNTTTFMLIQTCNLSNLGMNVNTFLRSSR